VKDFIGVYENAFSPDFCDGLILYYKWCKEKNHTWRRNEAPKSQKDDESCLVNPLHHNTIDFTSSHLDGYIREFNEIFWGKCYEEYSNVFHSLKTLSKHTTFTYKIQETHPGEGYHIWHCEQDGIENSRRIAAYIVYLNDVEEGGETEFLYQAKRVKPTQGTVVIFPSSYTHYHRGNPPISGDKYILTGWLEFF
jgi:2OG-Fe(II) oxygenase superfamily